MLVLVTYDVETVNPGGQRRLRHIAETCLDYGLRVQKSVFECQIDPAEWERLKATLLDIYEPEKDSLRFYFLGSNWERRVEHHGVNAAPEWNALLIL